MSDWYGVRCVFRWTRWEGEPYEERVTVWRAGSSDRAIELAQREAAAYAREHDAEYLGLAQCYGPMAEPDDGAEVFSLLRESALPPEEYLSAFFATGQEHQSD